MNNINRSIIGMAMRGVLVPALALAGMAACKDVTNLDESATTFISPDKYYQNDAQAASAVNGAYAPLLGWNGWKSPAQTSVMCEDNEMTCWNWEGGGWSGQQAGQWYMQDNSLYIGDYQIIERANEVLANVPGSKGISDAEKKIATGQALFIRGYAYFDLVRRYGGVPMRLAPYTPDAAMGALARSTVAQVYQQVAKDLATAAPLLPVKYSSPNGQGLPRQASAYGLLAKVYMHMAGDEATGTELAANRSAYIDSARIAALAEMAQAADPTVVSLEPNYMDLFDVNKQNTSPEILFAVQGAAVNNSGSQIPAQMSPKGDCTLAGGCGTGFIEIREDFIRSFTPGDQRLKSVAMSWEVTKTGYGPVRALQLDSLNKLKAAGIVVADKYASGGGWTEACAAFGEAFDSLTFSDGTTKLYAVARPYYTLKYIDPAHTTTDQSMANNFIILRHADVLLLFAEAENEKNGPTSAAYGAINQVRRRAGLPDLTGLDQAGFRAAVWKERAHELYGEFQARFDQIREGTWLANENAGVTIPDSYNGAHDFAGYGPCRPRQAYQKLQNIPNKEIASNPAIVQNPGY